MNAATAATTATRNSFRARMLGLTLLGNLGGALLTFLYFVYVDPRAVSGRVATTGAEIAYFVVASALLFAVGRHLSMRWLAPLTRAGGVLPPGPTGDSARRRALLLPAFVALASGGGWVAAAFIWGVLWPLLTGDFELSRALRQMFGITFVAGPFVAAIVFFGSERLMRYELPRLFPSGELSAVKVPKLRVRTRMLAAFLLLGLLPLAVLSVAALTRADALRTADAATAAAIIYNLKLVVVVLALGGLVVSVGLALLVAASVAQPLRDVQAAMAQVRSGGLDARCAVVSNDEIGAVAEGFNSMVQGLREREAIRETFGKYVSPEVRDEILAGRVSGAGVLREVTILFADLRDFTPWVEASPPAEVVADLNAYFTEMDIAIRAHGGLVLQFIGDEIEAVFGAPIEDARHADGAVAAAREMGRRLDGWNSARRAAGKAELRHGIGIHTGTVIAGNIGSSERMSYALVGDAVNLASRIQSLNKDFGTQVLVSGVTQAKLSSPAGLEALPAVHVKGRSAEVEVFALR
ncbi:MAG TPA: adenylate/guanylate cyclase domain-containing protein [Rubrivivax sp.]|nr:adenylate/guanylate cyclase domain-containing protein [Rubrivivax sp.]